MRIKATYFALLVFFAGCGKEIANFEKKDLSIKTAKISNKMETPDNAWNPADSIGIIHNKALHYVYTRLAAQKSFSTDLKRKYTVEFFEQRYRGKLLRSIEERQSKNLHFKKIPILKLSAYFPCSKVLAQSVHDILTAAYKMKAPKDYPEFKRKVVSLEQGVLNGKIKMSRTEADQLLHFCSVIRHSMWFWIDAIALDKELMMQNSYADS